MKILFVWTGITSYMADCWRELRKVDGVELKVVVDPLSDAQTAFKAEREFHGLDYRLVDEKSLGPGVEGIGSGGWEPDVIFLVGWRSKVSRYFAEDKRFEKVPKICCLDMPWRWKLRCILAPLFLRRYARRFAAAYVPGKVCEKYCKWIGFRRVEKGLFSMNLGKFWPHEADDYFLYLGRYSPEKRLDVMLEGYREYRRKGGKIPLKLYGKGEALPKGIENEEGISVNSFVAPEEVPRIFAKAAAFVLTSDFDPWPLVLLEAMGAGTKVVASTKCTNYPELGKGWVRFKAGDGKALGEALMSLEFGVESLGSREEKVKETIAMYDCKAWTERTLRIAREVKG